MSCWLSIGGMTADQADDVIVIGQFFRRCDRRVQDRFSGGWSVEGASEFRLVGLQSGFRRRALPPI